MNTVTKPSIKSVVQKKLVKSQGTRSSFENTNDLPANKLKYVKLSKDDVNAYLSKIGGLINGYTEEKIFDCSFFRVREGWYHLIVEMLDQLILVNWDKRILQVFERYGALVVYIDNYTFELFEIIREAERNSIKICEITGMRGKLRTEHGLWRTLSDDEFEKEIEIKF